MSGSPRPRAAGPNGSVGIPSLGRTKCPDPLASHRTVLTDLWGFRHWTTKCPDPLGLAPDGPDRSSGIPSFGRAPLGTAGRTRPTPASPMGRGARADDDAGMNLLRRCVPPIAVLAALGAFASSASASTLVVSDGLNLQIAGDDQGNVLSVAPTPA